jgi:hypothetical protein
MSVPLNTVITVVYQLELGILNRCLFILENFFKTKTKKPNQLRSAYIGSCFIQKDLTCAQQHALIIMPIIKYKKSVRMDL